MQTGESFRLIIRAQFAFLYHLGQRSINAAETFIDQLLTDFADGRFITGHSRDLRDARTHQTTADNTNLLDLHYPLSSIKRFIVKHREQRRSSPPRSVSPITNFLNRLD